ncbi:hypothetical protein [Ruania alba]|uniref:Glycosyl hydrolases family 32 N-terminal domain-containing protein n=1 Tax=Ruania alba TaxID=648782 RepID=A0A1H5KZ24_9MICO|nr:hypothetical protein [Ruania alba]SEE70102.1 Glycosyl hydrolases family 32 N-terminal domain-containing protein [Ruania alba]
MTAPADCIRSVYPSERSQELVLAPTFQPGDWRSLGVDGPNPFRLNGRLGMTLVGWDGEGYQTGLSWREEAGWSEPQLVFGRDLGSVHRRHNAAISSVVRDLDLYGDGELIAVDGWYHASYGAYPKPGYEEGSAVIGFVRTRDLVTWEEIGGLMRCDDGAAWERGGLYKSWLIRHDEQWWLFYNAKDHETGSWVEQIGLAVSDDLVTWHRVSDQPLVSVGAAGSFDERFAANPYVLRAEDGTWLMFYYGLGFGGGAVDLLATSPDLYTWTKVDRPLLTPGQRGSVDDRHAHKPAVIADGDRLLHFYCAVRGLEEPVTVGEYAVDEMRGIGMAWSW